MRYLSVCSGVEAATVAWHPLGWTPAGFAEIEPFPRAVLEQRHGAVAVDFDHRWSVGLNYTPMFGDFTQIEAHHVGPVDLLVGGTPCQAFSVAGKRLGLDDPRGNLTIEFFRLAKRLGARWVVWENVPGVLSNWSGEPDDDTVTGWDETNDFAAILALFRECGYRGCWRVLDAQYVRVDGFDGAVPQRRRRVFLVGHLGDDARAVPVLFDPESLRGIAAPRREARKSVAGAFGRDPARDRGAVAGSGIEPPSGTAGTVSAKWAKGSGGPAGDECSNLIAAPVANCLQTTCDDYSRSDGFNMVATAVAHTLRGEGFDASEDGTGRGTPMVAVPVAPTISARTRGGGGLGTDAECDGAVFAVCIHADAMNRDGVARAPSIDAAGVAGKRDAGMGLSDDVSFNLTAGAPHTVAFSIKDDGRDVSEDVSPCLRSLGAANSHANAGGQVAVAYSIQERAVSENPNAGPQGKGWQADISYTLEARHHVQAVAFVQNTRDEIRMFGGDGQSVGALGAQPGMKQQCFAAVPSIDGWAVRKLTPRECERLQGFPDDFTLITVRGKPAADGPRYKAIGNSMAVNVMRWIGARIDLVEKAVAAGSEAA